jgi:hydroxymethylbilane synthase
MTSLRIGTRSSRLALAQTEMVAERLRAVHRGIEVEFVEIATAGDRDQSTPLPEGVGWFTTAIQQALQRGEIDVAVHSYKDLPTKRPGGAGDRGRAVREDPEDALEPVGLTPASCQRAPSSDEQPETEAQVGRPPRHRHEGPSGERRHAHRQGRRGEFDAAVLALAGLKRLGLESRATEVFGVYDILPAPAQGALAVECRGDDTTTRELLTAIDDAVLRQIVTAERSFLARIDAGCSFPAAAYAEHFGTTLKLHGLLAPGGRIVRSKMAGPTETANGLGKALAEELMGLAGM